MVALNRMKLPRWQPMAQRLHGVAHVSSGISPMIVKSLLEYLRTLATAKQVLWCYLLWYVVMMAFHFDAAPRLWLNSLGISVVIGIGLILSVSGSGKPDFWTTARLFLMPFCVSTFSASIKGQGFVLVFSPAWREDLLALAVCSGFLLLCYAARQFAAQWKTQPGAPA
jgi:hypothetical protein